MDKLAKPNAWNGLLAGVNRFLRFPPPLPGGRKQGRDQLFVKREEMLHPFPVRGETGGAVKPVDGAVKVGMGAAQVGGHQVGVVKRGQRRPGMRRAGVKDGLGERFQFLERGSGAALGVGGGRIELLPRYQISNIR